MAVDRCICCDVPFSAVLEHARRTRARTVAELRRTMDIGSGCGRCVPYVQLALITECDDLPVLSDRECRRLAMLACAGLAEAAA